MTWRILLVDDDALVRDSMRRMLEFDQHTVVPAGSAVEALALSEKAAFDLAVLDYVMPITKGDQLARALKQRFPDLPIIMITADAEKLESPENRPAEVDILLGKPFQIADLRDAMIRLMVKS
jgi:CheY-like chemotaxis protein